MPKFDTQSHPILDSVKKVISGASLVKVSPGAIETLAEELAPAKDSPHWLTLAPASVVKIFGDLPMTSRLFFLTVFHSAGFSYWGTPRWSVLDGDIKYDGSMAWLVVLSRNQSLLEPTFLANLSADIWAKITAGESSIAMPMAAHRLALLQELGKKWPFISDTIMVHATTNGAALDLAFLLSKNLPGFDDSADCGGLTVAFLKRAQLLVCDWNYVITQAGLAPYGKIEQLTAFADYKIPQFLREKNVLRYADSLAHQVDNQIEIMPSSREEIEIRASTIYAVELLRLALIARRIDVKTCDLDNRLWLAAQQLDPLTVRPYHRCRTIYY
jgi:hypothetical protein